MPASITEWQKLLLEHFTALSAKRKESGFFTFAIEHGLSQESIAEFKAAVRQQLTSGYMRHADWLSWVVYATEHGYQFDGQHFWDGFADQTPNWISRGDRGYIRDWCAKFHKEFNGVVPTGSWAKHFSIIAWPISNALLPVDLQRGLARALYECQFILPQLVGAPPREIARAIAQRTHHGSQRLQFFLEQEDLVGQIVISILQTPSEDSTSIETRTLTRITNDVSRAQDAAEWIRHAQNRWRSAAAQVKIAGRFRANGGRGDLPPTIEPKDRQNPSSAIVLEAIPTSNQSYRLDVTIPSLQTALSRDSRVREFLRSTKLSIPRASEQMLPGEWLLVGIRRFSLQSWPAQGEPLIEYVDATPPDDNPCWSVKLPTRKNLLFKISTDGSAKLLTGMVVRPGGSYLLGTTDEKHVINLGALCKSNCSGLSLYRIDLPNLISDDLLQSLLKLGLKSAPTVSVRPVGFPPTNWDAESGGEWLSTVQPMLEISRDHEFDSYMIALDGEEFDQGTKVEPDQTAIVLLPHLEIGSHVLRILTCRSEANGVKKVRAQIEIGLEIRAPRPWTGGSSELPGAVIRCAPLNPSIDDIQLGRFELEVLGNIPGTLRISLVLRNDQGDETLRNPIFEKKIPISAEDWRVQLTKYSRTASNELYSSSFSEAYVELASETCGYSLIPLDRTFTPLHWFLEKKRNPAQLKIAYQGDKNEVSALAASFHDPMNLQAISLGNEMQLSEYKDGLYVANAKDSTDSLLIAPDSIHAGLEALRLPTPSNAFQGVQDYGKVIELARIWHFARPNGYLAGVWQRQISEKFFWYIQDHFCGTRWGKAEDRLADSPTNGDIWLELESLVSGAKARTACSESNFGIAVGKIRLDPALPKAFVNLKSLVDRYSLKVSDELFSTACRIANFDSTFESISKQECDEICRDGMIVRAARLVVLRLKYMRIEPMKFGAQ